MSSLSDRWQRHCELRAFVQLTANTDTAAVQLNDFLCERQAEPGSCRVPNTLVIAAEESIEDSSNVLERDSVAAVFDMNPDL